MNDKGFTLVELIAMMVVLGLLMAITVPNMAGILKMNKNNITIEDVNKMIGNAKAKFKTKEAKYPTAVGECKILTLGFIDSNDDFKKGINNGTYSKTKSYIVVKRQKTGVGVDSYTYKYYVRLVEENKNRQYSIDLFDYDDFTEKPIDYIATDKVKIGELNAGDDIVAASNPKDKVDSLKPGLCSNVTKVYN